MADLNIMDHSTEKGDIFDYNVKQLKWSNSWGGQAAEVVKQLRWSSSWGGREAEVAEVNSKGNWKFNSIPRAIKNLIQFPKEIKIQFPGELNPVLIPRGIEFQF